MTRNLRRKLRPKRRLPRKRPQRRERGAAPAAAGRGGATTSNPAGRGGAATGRSCWSGRRCTGGRWPRRGGLLTTGRAGAPAGRGRQSRNGRSRPCRRTRSPHGGWRLGTAGRATVRSAKRTCAAWIFIAVPTETGASWPNGRTIPASLRSTEAAATCSDPICITAASSATCTYYVNGRAYDRFYNRYPYRGVYLDVYAPARLLSDSVLWMGLQSVGCAGPLRVGLCRQPVGGVLRRLLHALTRSIPAPHSGSPTT